MKAYTMYKCEKCGKESASYDAIKKCEAMHLGITVAEMTEYGELKERVRAWGAIMARTNNQENRDCEENAINELIGFERRHGIE